MSFQGFKTKILSKITSLTVVHCINKFIFNRHINNIKAALFKSTTGYVIAYYSLTYTAKYVIDGVPIPKQPGFCT